MSKKCIAGRRIYLYLISKISLMFKRLCLKYQISYEALEKWWISIPAWDEDKHLIFLFFSFLYLLICFFFISQVWQREMMADITTRCVQHVHYHERRGNVSFVKRAFVPPLEMSKLFWNKSNFPVIDSNWPLIANYLF